MTDSELLDKLVGFVGQDPRLEHIDVTSQPAQFRILIGGQTPFWEFPVDVARLRAGNLPVYALAIVDHWEDRRR